ncbi:benzoate/H(+) symporter BenE family transporter [Luteolibacter flavescens]|uniref:Benzoate/H(+) symporter BenE family transporter n=1 Tax=Luteolibacter flavescens TaxID=1859460 RepID=A0ABT3FPY3_9BACT|nr:benzoate/H(+) symporter BenE family transporter [Luteolibacter flavescens]MCW1885291.1 benzoate/H(+) symporter BenE family transporter [Luteolibacter flavescens]
MIFDSGHTPPERRSRTSTRSRSHATLKDFSLSALVTGFVSVLVGFTSSVAIIFQTTQNLGAMPGQTAS